MVARAERSGTPQRALVGPRRPAAVPIRPPPRTVGPHRQPACPHGPGGPRLFRARGGGAASLPTWTRRTCAARPPGPRPAHADQGAWGDAGGGAGSAAARRGTHQSAPSPRERYLLLARTVLVRRENGTYVVRTDGASGCPWGRVARSARQWVLGSPGARGCGNGSGAAGQSFEEAVRPGSGRLGAARVVSGRSSRWFMWSSG